MGINVPKERATYSLDATVKRQLEESVPASQRSSYVERAIVAALRQDALKEFSVFLDNLPKATGGEDSVEFLRRKRREWDGRPVDMLDGGKT
jgi:hypothetical protein